MKQPKVMSRKPAELSSKFSLVLVRTEEENLAEDIFEFISIWKTGGEKMAGRSWWLGKTSFTW